MGETLRFSLRAAFSELSRVRPDLVALLDRHDVGDRARYAVDVALEEIGTNVIKYALPAGSRGSFDLTVEVGADGGVTLVFEDDGPAFDPTAQREETGPERLEQRSVGRVGLPLLRAWVDHVRYSRAEDRNRLEVRIDAETGKPPKRDRDRPDS
jgi:anti-sigma regulatory factor (Ser/Thr protein kinase)